MRKIAFCILCTLALAAHASTYYGFKIGGVSVNSDNYKNVTGSNITVNVSGYDSGVSYDPRTNTVTIENVKISRTGSGNRCILNESNDGLIVLFKGQNSSLSSTTCAPIRVEANTTFTCSELTFAYVYGKDGDANCLYATDGATVRFDHASFYMSLTGNSNAAVTAESSTSENLYFHHSRVIIKSEGNSALRNFATVNANGSALLFHTDNSDANAVGNLNYFNITTTDNTIVGYGTNIGKLTDFTFEGGANYSTQYRSFRTNMGTSIKGKDVIISDRIYIGDNVSDPVLRAWLNEKFGNYLETYEIFGIRTLNINTNANAALKEIKDWEFIKYFTCLRRLWINGGKWNSLNFSRNSEFYHLRCYDNKSEDDIDWYNVSSLPFRLDDNHGTIEGFNTAASERNYLPPLDRLKNFSARKYDFIVKNGDNTYTLRDDENFLPIDRSTFPDDNLRTHLYSLSEGADAVIYDSEMPSITSLVVPNQKIKDLTGIEKLPNLTKITCSNNDIQQIDLSGNPQLTLLYCYNNYIKSDGWDYLIDHVAERHQPLKVYCYSVNSAEKGNDLPTIAQVARAKAKDIHFCYGNGVELVDYIPIESHYFPDENFRQYLRSQDYGKDDKLYADEIEDIDMIRPIGKDIADLTGIKYFTAATYLDCSGNKLTELDVSKNTNLKILSCYNNQIGRLDLSKNTNLSYLDCCGNGMTELNLSGLDSMTYLACSLNQIESLDLAGKPKLGYVNVSGNRLTTLDLTGDNSIYTLMCWCNQIKGEGMDAMIATLPSSILDEYFRVYNTHHKTYAEGNEMTAVQVDAAKARGVVPYYYNGTQWVSYDGKTEVLPGDVNGDGSVNTGDVSELYGVILGAITDETTLGRAMITDDDEVNVGDISALYQIILGQ